MQTATQTYQRPDTAIPSHPNNRGQENTDIKPSETDIQSRTRRHTDTATHSHPSRPLTTTQPCPATYGNKTFNHSHRHSNTHMDKATRTHRHTIISNPSNHYHSVISIHTHINEPPPLCHLVTHSKQSTSRHSATHTAAGNSPPHSHAATNPPTCLLECISSPVIQLSRQAGRQQDRAGHDKGTRVWILN